MINVGWWQEAVATPVIWLYGEERERGGRYYPPTVGGEFNYSICCSVSSPKHYIPPYTCRNIEVTVCPVSYILLKGQCQELTTKFFFRILTHVGLDFEEIFACAKKFVVSLTPWSQAQRCHWHHEVWLSVVNDFMESHMLNIIFQKLILQFKETDSRNFETVFSWF